MEPNELKKAIAERIKGLRTILELSVEDAAKAVGVSAAEYSDFESGAHSFPYWFLNNCAKAFGIDVVELISGDAPHLTGYTIARQGVGLKMRRREGFRYDHLAHLFKNRNADPFVVVAPYGGRNEVVELDTHEGQEFDYVISGRMRFVFEQHEEILEAGDSVYYDSGRRHGMCSLDGIPCVFLAVVAKNVL
ncbi:MAG: XRE family transcriptional regulator [Oscillospiraceae bacterium]|jgi:mannose-6-phosphate isomerase-like protein (cupin superfamily)|nr:XRE family transcriptional regulator [Oscillospiraceae bacterium]